MSSKAKHRKYTHNFNDKNYNCGYISNKKDIDRKAMLITKE